MKAVPGECAVLPSELRYGQKEQREDPVGMSVALIALRRGQQIPRRSTGTMPSKHRQTKETLLYEIRLCSAGSQWRLVRTVPQTTTELNAAVLYQHGRQLRRLSRSEVIDPCCTYRHV